MMIIHNKYFEREFEIYCVKCNDKYTNFNIKWCQSCQINYLKENFTNWTNGDEKSMI
jgi:hypothetical protein